MSSRSPADVLEGVVIEESSIRAVLAFPGCVILLVEAALADDHPARDPRSGEASSTVPAVVWWSEVSELTWTSRRCDEMGTHVSDVGTLAALSFEDGRCRVDWGAYVIDAVATQMTLRLDGPSGPWTSRTRLAPTPQHQDRAAGVSALDGVLGAHLNPDARRRATATALRPVDAAPPGPRRFWTSEVESALEYVSPLPPVPLSTAWPFATRSDETDYTEIETFGDVHLEESTIHTVVITPGSVAFLLDAFILTTSPYWREARPGEWATWLPATLRFVGVSELRWVDGHQRPTYDATGEKDHGNIHALKTVGTTHQLTTGIGDLEIVARTVDLDVDAEQQLS